MQKVELAERELVVVQEALAALHGMYGVQVSYSREEKYWRDKLCALEEVAQSIENQTGVVLPREAIPRQPVAPY